MSGATIGPRMVSLMELAAGFQARVRLDAEAVADYAAVLGDGGRMPPIVVFLDEGGVMRVGDGHHRVAAARQAGRKELPADVRAGSERDARRYALFKANRMNGLRMTPEDKRKAVREALMDPEWGAWSDRQISKEMSVSHTFVAKVRAEVTGSVASDLSPAQRTYVTRHGTEAVMDTSNIGRRQMELGSTASSEAAPPAGTVAVTPAPRWHPDEGYWHSYANDTAAWHVVPVLGAPGQFWVSRLLSASDGESYYSAGRVGLQTDMVHEVLQMFGLDRPESVKWDCVPHTGLDEPFGRPAGSPKRVKLSGLVDPAIVPAETEGGGAALPDEEAAAGVLA